MPVGLPTENVKSSLKRLWSEGRGRNTRQCWQLRFYFVPAGTSLCPLLVFIKNRLLWFEADLVKRL